MAETVEKRTLEELANSGTLEILDRSILRGDDILVRTKEKEGLFTTNKLSFEYILEDFASGFYRCEILEQIKDFFADKKYKKYIKEAGLWPIAEMLNNNLKFDVEDEKAILENAKNILKEKNTYNKVLADIEIRSWKRIVEALKLLGKLGKEDYFYTAKLYDNEDLSNKGIKKLIKYAKKASTIPDYKGLPSSLVVRRGVYKDVLNHLKNIKSIREQEFPLGTTLDEIVESYELTKVNSEKARKALEIVREAKEEFKKKGTYFGEREALLLTKDGKLIYGGNDPEDWEEKRIDPEIAEVLFRVYESGKYGKMPENRAYALGF